MSIRTTIGRRLEATIGRGRTDTLRRLERRVRTAAASRLAMDGGRVTGSAATAAARPAPAPVATTSTTTSATTAPAPATGYAPGRGPSDPFVPHPKPPMSRHAFLRGLHERTRPRTYLEVGVADGASMRLSRTTSIGIDPAFHINKPIHCNVQLVRDTSDRFFARPDPLLAHFGGVPVDLGFIDGMHLSEYALRDFINLEPWMAPTGVVLIDDVLPRNGLEAARDRQTRAWTGDVYKAVEVIARRRPDLVVLLVNTAPTGTALVFNPDPTSTVLGEAFAEEEAYLLKPDPQTPPQEYMDRSTAVDPAVLLDSPVWAALLASRESGEPVSADVWQALRQLGRG